MCLKCALCAFAKNVRSKEAYTFSLEEIFQRAKQASDEGATELHIVGGLHPDLPFDYYLDMLRGLKQRFPQMHLKAFTAVEIDFFAKLDNISIEETLQRLKDAGLDSMPGGGAEIFEERARNQVAKGKMSGQEWLDVVRIAHRMGLHSNATMLYGHVETIEERVDHMLALRDLQDETDGFMTFIPLAFHSANTPLDHLPETSGFDDLKNIAISRLMLDNFPAYQVLLDHGRNADRTDVSSFWRRRYRRHRCRGKNHACGGGTNSAGRFQGGSDSHDPRRGLHSGRTRYSLPELAYRFLKPVIPTEGHMKKIGVIGAGTMGSGIVQTFAEKGFEVYVFESYAPVRTKAEERVGKGIRKRVEKKQLSAEDAERSIRSIRWCEDIGPLADTDFVVEAIIESFDAKADVFRQLDQITRPEVILASNTSSISITKIANVTKRADRCHRHALHESCAPDAACGNHSWTCHQ